MQMERLDKSENVGNSTHPNGDEQQTNQEAFPPTRLTLFQAPLVLGVEREFLRRLFVRFGELTTDLHLIYVFE